MTNPIIAAGGVVWREGKKGGIEIAMVHRPRYDDWSLPKGKQDPGEALIACAYREIMEETGLNVQIGQYIGEIGYFTIDGAKRVYYWSAKALDSQKTFKANNEVDQLVWADIDRASNQLTRESDIEILAKFSEMEFDATPLVLLRHAKALARKEWQGGDEDRPLDYVGQMQAKRMLSIYQVFGLQQIHTSDAVRCYDTIIAMSKALGLEPKVTNHLSEYIFEKNKEKALDYAKDLVEKVGKSGAPTLLCSHNPILPRMLEKVTKKSKVDLPLEKLQPGDAWVLFFKKKKCVAIDLITAPEV
jgi:8-oxo-dGTP diphosphatase